MLAEPIIPTKDRCGVVSIPTENRCGKPIPTENRCGESMEMAGHCHFLAPSVSISYQLPPVGIILHPLSAASSLVVMLAGHCHSLHPAL